MICKTCKGTGRVYHLHTQEGPDKLVEATCSVCSGAGKLSRKEKTIVTVNLVDHNDQRYDTVGDWQFENDNHLTVTVSNCEHEGSEILVAIHEIIEAILCKVNGISGEVVDTFDLENIDHPDPGSIPGCPYYREHMFATMIERSLAAEMQIEWEAHEEILESL